jgi:hypothetical protein
MPEVDEMAEGRPFDDHVQEHRVTTDAAEIQAFDGYTDAFCMANRC